MDDNHVHEVRPLRYTLTLTERHWWGGRKQLVIVGTSSSKQDNEILIRLESGGFWSLNYDYIMHVRVEPIMFAPGKKDS